MGYPHPYFCLCFFGGLVGATGSCHFDRNACNCLKGHGPWDLVARDIIKVAIPITTYRPN